MPTATRLSARSDPIATDRTDLQNGLSAGKFDSSMPLGPTQKQRKLPGKIVFFYTQRTFEKARELTQYTNFAAPIRQLDEPNQVQHERRCEQ